MMVKTTLIVGKLEQVPMGLPPVIYVLRNAEYPRHVLIGTAAWVSAARRRIAAAGPMTAAYPDIDGFPQEHTHNLEDVRSFRDRRPVVNWMLHLSCAGMLPGDEDAAAELRESLWVGTRERGYYPPLYMTEADRERWREHDRGSTPWRVASDEFLAWLAANSTPWDDSCVEQLGIKAKPKAKPKAESKPRPPAGASTIAERMARRRAKG